MELNSKIIKAFWWMSNNFGDNLNYLLISKLGNGQPVFCFDQKEEHFIVCGSILALANENSIVWGAGFGDETQSLNEGAKVISVRGNISASRISKKPQFVGDPALLMPSLFPCEKTILYEYGVIPHFLNYQECLAAFPTAHFINPLQDVQSLIKEINSCGYVYSASLHGLVLCDAYEIPNCWIKSNSYIGGDGFKFADYYSTVDVDSVIPININDGNVIDFDKSHFSIKKYKYDINEYMNSCPFKNL